MEIVVAEATDRISRRADGKYFLYLPKTLVEDSAFPFEVVSSTPVKVTIDSSTRRLIVSPISQVQQRRTG